MPLINLIGKTLRVVEQQFDALLVQDISSGFNGIEHGPYYLLVSRRTGDQDATLDVVKP